MTRFQEFSSHIILALLVASDSESREHVHYYPTQPTWVIAGGGSEINDLVVGVQYESLPRSLPTFSAERFVWVVEHLTIPNLDPEYSPTTCVEYEDPSGGRRVLPLLTA